MTLDQKIQIWNAVGTWVAGFGTLAAVVLSLWLAGRSERIDLKVTVGVRQLFGGDGTPPEENIAFAVTNAGPRPVTVSSVGWRVGRRKAARYCLQTLCGRYSSQYPKTLQHGEQSTFMVSFKAAPNWAHEFATGFVRDLSERNLQTLVAQVHTSVGKTVLAKPERSVLERLRNAVA